MTTRTRNAAKLHGRAVSGAGYCGRGGQVGAVEGVSVYI